MSSAFVEPSGSTLFVAKRYRLLEKLGRGGMGEVWSAYDLLTKQEVALKKLALSSFKDSGFAPVSSSDADETIASVSAFGSSETAGYAATVAVINDTPRTSDSTQALRLALAQEFRVLASMRHPGIISVLDYGFDDERQPYFTMELLEGPLDLLAASRELSVEKQISLLIKILQALTYLHRREILHRDLKPANVLVQDGIPKVLDFGLAVKQSAARELAGSVRYMAPEIFLGESASVASDPFSFGVMAYEVLAGTHPFPIWKNIQELIDFPAPDVDPIRTLSPANRENPVQLDAVIARLLKKEPEERYQSAIAVIEDLSLAIGEAPPAETQAIRESFLQAAEFVGRDTELGEFRKALKAL